jgi:hypothetical protein
MIQIYLETGSLPSRTYNPAYSFTSHQMGTTLLGSPSSPIHNYFLPTLIQRPSTYRTSPVFWPQYHARVTSAPISYNRYRTHLALTIGMQIDRLFVTRQTRFLVCGSEPVFFIQSRDGNALRDRETLHDSFFCRPAAGRCVSVRAQPLPGFRGVMYKCFWGL